MLQESHTGIIMPTCNPDIALNRLLPSVVYIKEMAETAKWLINFNGGWRNYQIRQFIYGLESFGFRVAYTCTKGWDKPMKLILMRELCAELDPYCDLYLFIDDDFKFMKDSPKYPFSSGRRYLHSIDYMTRFDECGAVNTKSFLGGSPQKLKIIPTINDMHATNQGLLLRNMSDHGFLLAPTEIRELRGGLEEQTMVYSRIELGYYAAKQMNNPTVHVTGKLCDWDNDPTDFHNVGVIDNNLAKYIKSKYGQEWEYQNGRMPKKLYEMYKSSPYSPDLEDEVTIDMLTVDYAEFETHWDPSTIGDSRIRKKK